MKTSNQIIEIAISTIREEAQAVENLTTFIDHQFARSVDLIMHAPGRLIITGIGKSANIASKIVSTLNSTGTPAIFMHAADAIHGDLGIVRKEDVVMCISKSGNTPEIKVLIPLIKMRGNHLIGMTGNVDSFLAKQSEFVLNTTVAREACPNNLAPTSSTTAQLVMGDALAVALLECRGFSSADFARFHPGGALGKKLYMRVSDLYIHNEVPKVKADDDIKAVIMEISSKRLGATAVLDAQEQLVGIITDGDLRRMLQRETQTDGLQAKDIMSPQPKTVDAATLAVDAFDVMRSKNITQMLVEKEGCYVGVVHLHDILKEGII